MVFPLETVKLIKNSSVKRPCPNQGAQLPRKPAGIKSQRAYAISLQQIQAGNEDLFHPKMKKQTKTGKKQYKIDCDQPYIFPQITRTKWR